jgi:hypothetical protein
LVANHSGAKYEAEIRGLDEALAEFPDEISLARDSLWFCDMTTGPGGARVTFDERLAEIRQRYGVDHAVSKAMGAAAGEIRAAISNVLERVREYGLAMC